MVCQPQDRYFPITWKGVIFPPWAYSSTYFCVCLCPRTHFGSAQIHWHARNIHISFWRTIDKSKNPMGPRSWSFPSLLWPCYSLFYTACPMAKYYSCVLPIDDVYYCTVLRLYLLFCILGYSEVQRQRLIFYDLTSVQHGTHHCLYILCYPYPKGEYWVTYFLST